MSPVRSSTRTVNTILLSDGSEVDLAEVRSAAEAQAILDDVDAAILRIEAQLEAPFDERCAQNTDWDRRARGALKRKRQQRPRIQFRIAELRRTERSEKAGTASQIYAEAIDAKRGAFVKAAYQLLGHEVCTEVWARAAELKPEAFTDGQVAA